jgi:ABC-type transporter Mla MlaB component
MAFQIGCTSDSVTLELDGDNSVKHAVALHQQLLAAGVQTKSVTVDAQHSGTVDITVIQILAALQACCSQIRIVRPSQEFLSSLDRCGMRRHVRAALRQEKRGEEEQP